MRTGLLLSAQSRPAAQSGPAGTVEPPHLQHSPAPLQCTTLPTRSVQVKMQNRKNPCRLSKMTKQRMRIFSMSESSLVNMTRIPKIHVMPSTAKILR